MSNVYGAVRFRVTATGMGMPGLATAAMVDVYRITKSTGAVLQVVTDGAAIEIGQGMYGYVYNVADTLLYLYLAVFTTADITVDDKQPCVWMADLAESAQTALEATLTAMKGAGWVDETLTTIQADLDNPNQYKADVSALALEATLTAMKGAGWTGAQNLVAILAAITAGTLTPAMIDAYLTIWHGSGSWQKLTAALGGAGAAQYRGGDLSVIRGDIYSVANPLLIYDLGTLAGVTEIYVTVKLDPADADPGVFQKTLTSGAVVILDLAAGNIRVDLSHADTDHDPQGGYTYDVLVTGPGIRQTRRIGGWYFVSNVTRA